VESHLAECADCRALAEELRASQALLGELRDEPLEDAMLAAVRGHVLRRAITSVMLIMPEWTAGRKGVGGHDPGDCVQPGKCAGWSLHFLTRGQLVRPWWGRRFRLPRRAKLAQRRLQAVALLTNHHPALFQADLLPGA
jgi:hypothetical protein